MKTIIHICGAGRSGSTLLELILANQDKTLSLGGTRMLWQLGFKENLLMPDGTRFLDDPLWQDIKSTIIEKSEYDLADEINAQIRVKKIPAMLIRAALRQYGQRWNKLRDILAKCFDRLLAKSGKDYLIDSTSSVAYTLLLNSLPGYRVINVHLVRHPRAVSYSWKRPKPQPEHDNKKQMISRSRLRSDADWAINNFALKFCAITGIVQNHITISYEELCEAPKMVMAKIDRLIQASDFESLDLERLAYVPSKGVAGNPIRFQTGPLTIKSDIRWKKDYKGGIADWVYRAFTPGQIRDR